MTREFLLFNIISNICKQEDIWYNKTGFIFEEGSNMKHIKTLNTKNLQCSAKKGGCGECQTSCQSACKTSCTVGNQACEK